MRENMNAELVFSALETYKALAKGHRQGDKYDKNEEVKPEGFQVVPISFSSLVHTVIDPTSEYNEGILRHINTSLIYRRQYYHLVKHMSSAYSPRLAAASSDAEVTQRKGEDFSLYFDVANTLHQDMVNVTLNTDNAKLRSCSFLHLQCFWQDKAIPLKLEKEDTGIFSATCLKSSLVHNAMRDVDCEIFIH